MRTAFCADKPGPMALGGPGADGLAHRLPHSGLHRPALQNQCNQTLDCPPCGGEFQTDIGHPTEEKIEGTKTFRPVSLFVGV
jgi:hypothetical protein